ncbi:MAG: hypothetical protein ACC656_13240, partial [Candidatus Heimdallarchaeota archaeon]
MPQKQNIIPCNNCNGIGKIKVTINPHTKYRCNQCNLVVQNKTKACKNHGSAGSYATDHPIKVIDKKCRVCGSTGVVEGLNALEPASIDEISLGNNGLTNVVDSLQKSIQFDRKLMQTVRQFKNTRLNSLNHPFSFIKAIAEHITKYRPRDAIDAFRQAFMPDEVVKEIVDTTDCDKWTEKTSLSNIMMWTLTFFLHNKTEDLAIVEIANASASLLGRELSDDKSAVDHNTVGVRLEKPELIQALEMMLQVCSAQLGTNAFEGNGTFINIYYDWFYLVKSGNSWQACLQVGRMKESNAIKIGIGIEYNTKAVVSLVMHGERNRNDVVSFKEHLMLT